MFINLKDFKCCPHEYWTYNYNKVYEHTLKEVG